VLGVVCGRIGEILQRILACADSLRVETPQLAKAGVEGGQSGRSFIALYGP
jgi:hypothetical protein